MAHNIEDMVYETNRAKAKAFADVQDEQIERERRRRVAEANRAAFDAARDAERGSRGGAVSSMNQWGPDGSVASSFSNTVFGPQTGGIPIRDGWDAMDTQARIGSEFADLARRSAAVKQHNARISADSMNAAMRVAMANGGRLPQNAVDMLSRNLGLDGRNSAVYSAGYLNNGDFDIDIVTRGANGGLQRTTKKITPLEQYNMMLAAPGVWGEDGVAASQGLYNRLRNTRGKSELQSPSVYADNLRAYNTQKQSADTLKLMTGLYQTVYKDLSKGGKQPVTTDVIRARMASDLLKDKNIGPQITSVPDLNPDGTQKMVEDENGNQVPAMRQADPNNPDDVERVKQNLKMRLELVPELAQRQDAQGGGEADRRLAFLKYIYDRENPPTPPDVLAFQQGQRQRQMRQVEEAQARADITQRPQQIINYYKDGKWYSGNGYIRDGKVYDGQGYEIAGATPAEMARDERGQLVKDGNGGFVTRALPSAADLVSGNVGKAVKADSQNQQQKKLPELTDEEKEEAKRRLREREERRKSSTKLSDEDEVKFLEWEKTLPSWVYNLGDRIDLRGYWRDSGMPTDPESVKSLFHTWMDDRFGKNAKTELGKKFAKTIRQYYKPNHSEFSTDSIYATGENEKMAGTFGEDGRYVPSVARRELEAQKRELDMLEKLKENNAVVERDENTGKRKVTVPMASLLPADDELRFLATDGYVWKNDDDYDTALKYAREVQDKVRERSAAKKAERKNRQQNLAEWLLKEYPSDSKKRERIALVIEDAYRKFPDDENKRKQYLAVRLSAEEIKNNVNSVPLGKVLNNFKIF